MKRLLLAVLLVFSVVLTGGGVVHYPGSGSASSVNRVLDTDGDGNADYVVVQGDYNGDGSVDPDDIQDAHEALADTDSPRTIVVRSGLYDGSDFATGRRALVSLDANTTLRCEPGATLIGWVDTTLDDTTVDKYLIANSAIVDPSDLTASGDDATDDAIFVEGCTAYYELTASYDTTAWTGTGNYFGIYLEKVTDGAVRNNEISDTIHSCIYIRSSARMEVSGNKMPNNCGNADDACSASCVNTGQNGIYLFASEGVDTEDVTIAENICNEAGSHCFHTRAEHVCTGTDDGDEDGDLCNLDNSTTGSRTDCTATNGTCSEARIKNVTMVSNVARNAVNGGLEFGSGEGITVVGNVAEGNGFGIWAGGIPNADITAGVQDLCSEASVHDDAQCGNVIANNVILNSTTAGIRVGPGHEDLHIIGNDIYTVTAGDCIRVDPPFDTVSVIGNHAADCTESTAANTEFLAIPIITGADTPENLFVRLNTMSEIGGEAGNMVDIDVVVANPVITDNVLTGGSTAPSDCIDLDATPTGALIARNDCGDSGDSIASTTAIVDSLREGSWIWHNDEDTSNSSTCQNGAIWQDLNATASGSIQVCRNGSFVSLD